MSEELKKRIMEEYPEFTEDILDLVFRINNYKISKEMLKHLTPSAREVISLIQGDNCSINSLDKSKGGKNGN